MKNYTIEFERIPNRASDADGIVRLPLILMDEQVILPSLVTSVNISHEISQDTATDVAQQGITALALYVEDDIEDVDILTARQAFGTEVALIPFLMRPMEEMILMAQGRRRLQLLEVTRVDGIWEARARLVEDIIESEAEIEQSVTGLKALFGQLTQYDNSISEDVAEHLQALQDVTRLCYELATVTSMDVVMQQQLLETASVTEMLEQVRFHLSLQLVRFETHERINSRVQDKAAYEQRRVYLQEQLEAIQTELGSEDYSQGDLGKLQQAIREAGMPNEVQAKAQEELKRLAQMPLMTPEATVVRGYLEWLTSIPWREKTEDNLDLSHAEKVLDRAHFGLTKVKERIIEHIAVRKLAREKMKSPILCFVGPPGVGKTSLGRSIAEALGREFVRVSLGGIRDEAEIRGHRRTYIGSMPGRIIQTMKRAGTLNPVFMLDEIDKLSEDYRGDPASALLEVLDPEQNQEFVDHYLEVPYDLSQTLFIATANDLYPLPEALEDRMEVIEFRSYTEEEKLEIAHHFLIPKQLEAHGIAETGVRFQPDALKTIIRQYTMEAGVRNLEREIANVCRKITRLVAMEKPYPRRITASLAEKYLGPPHIIPTRANREDGIGNVTGLVWTTSGGDIQNVEVSLLPGKGGLTMTGQLGEVLQESAQAAMSYMRSQADSFDVDTEDFEDYDIHIHLPEGAVPKDGPSAGITLACGIISIFTERKVRSQCAMTGEITLRGHVLPVGGVKEKVLAARRYGISDVILPIDNKKDLVDIPKSALKNLNIHFVSSMQEVIALVLHEPPEVRERDLKRQQEREADSDAEEPGEKPAKKSKKQK